MDWLKIFLVVLIKIARETFIILGISILFKKRAIV